MCVFAESDGPLLGLRTFCIPLRASNLQPTELKKIVFVGDGDYLRREWEQLCNFPAINVMPVCIKLQCREFTTICFHGLCELPEKDISNVVVQCR